MTLGEFTRGTYLNQPEGLGLFVTVMAAINGCCMFLTILFNTTALLAITCIRSLHNPSNSLLAALCAVGLASALLIQSTYQAMLLMPATGLATTRSFQIFVVSFTLYRGLLCLTTALISLDRFTAVCQPFFYLGRVTIAKYMTFWGSICGVWFVYCLLVIPADSDQLFYASVVVCILLTTFVTLYCSVKILHVVHKQRRRVQTVGKISGRNASKCSRRRRESGKAFFIVIEVFVFIFGNGPCIIILLHGLIYGETDSKEKAFIGANIMVLFSNINCVINPLLYCLRSSDIRKTTKRVLLKRREWR